MPRKRHYNRTKWSKPSKYSKQRVVKQEKEEENPTPQSAGWKETRDPCGAPEVEELPELTSVPDIPSCMNIIYPYIPIKHSVLTLPHKPYRPTTLKQAVRDVVEAIERELKRREAEQPCDAEKKRIDAWLDSILQ
jgi:hypothetical protein